MCVKYLVRHGQASFNADNYDNLSEKGCRQAKLVGEYLAQKK
jgi:broad specificity phosphatase PhoE